MPCTLQWLYPEQQHTMAVPWTATCNSCTLNALHKQDVRYISIFYDYKRRQSRPNNFSTWGIRLQKNPLHWLNLFSARFLGMLRTMHRPCLTRCLVRFLTPHCTVLHHWLCDKAPQEINWKLKTELRKWIAKNVSSRIYFSLGELASTAIPCVGCYSFLARYGSLMNSILWSGDDRRTLNLWFLNCKCYHIIESNTLENRFQSLESFSSDCKPKLLVWNDCNWMTNGIRGTLIYKYQKKSNINKA